VTVDLSPERPLLLRQLADVREHVLDQLEGLSDEQLHRPVLPSGWSCLGLVRHLTLSDERYWFEVVVAGEPLDFWPGGDNGDWRVDPAVRVAHCQHGLAWTRGRLPALLDGEPHWLDSPAEIRFKRHAFRALVPPPAEPVEGVIPAP